MYDYLESMKEDIREWIEDEKWFEEHELDDAYDDLYDALWIADSVTGNASGSYTFNSYQAKEFVMDNIELLKEAVREFCTASNTICDRFLDEDWEWFDVTIRCYMLGRALGEVLEELEGR